MVRSGQRGEPEGPLQITLAKTELLYPKNAGA